MSVELKVLIREEIERLLEEDIKFAEGEKVKTTDGKEGEITLAKHPFYAIKLSDGSTKSFHFSDLIKATQEKMEYAGDLNEISAGLAFHIKNKLSLFENVFRPESKAYFDLFNEARQLYNEGLLKVTKEEAELLESGIGHSVIIENKTIHLGLPFLDDAEFLTEESSNFPKTVVVDKETSIKGTQFKIGDIVSIQYQFDDDGESFYSIKGYGVNNQNVKILHIPKKEIDSFLKNTSVYLKEAKTEKKTPPIGKPKRGGSKKFYVYVKNPKTKKIKKVSFGDTSGLRAKLNNSKARQAFSKRHNCPQKKDRTKASYWSCRLPRYAKLLGFKTSFSGFW